MSRNTAPNWKLHLPVPLVISNNMATFCNGYSLSDILLSQQFPTSFNGQIYKLSYFVRAIVKHKEYGEGSAIDIPINIKPGRINVN